MLQKKKYEDMRSCWEFGEASECRKGLMCGMGYTPEEQKRPLIGVVNSWNEYNPGHVHLDKLAERVKQGIREAGGLPVEVMTTAVCDGMVMKDPRYIEVPSRNLIADQVELTSESNMFDGMVLLSTCDSIVPGHLMACARLDIPSIIVTGGYMPLGIHKGKEVIHIHAQDKVGAAAKGMMDMESQMMESALVTAGQIDYCKKHNLEYEELSSVYNKEITVNEEILGKDTESNFWYCYAFEILVFMMIVLYGQMIATSVTTEKSNRSIEVLVTSTTPTSLLFGKVIAGAIASVMQVGIVLVCILGSYQLNREAWGGSLDMIFNIPAEVLVTFGFFGLGGFLFYAFLWHV